MTGQDEILREGVVHAGQPAKAKHSAIENMSSQL